MKAEKLKVKQFKVVNYDQNIHAIYETIIDDPSNEKRD